MLASRPSSRPNKDGSFGGERDAATRQPPTGRRRLLSGYAASLLAAVLGLPGLLAGAITANNCQLRGLDCVGRTAYGPLAGAVLATIVLLVLAIQFRLGWRFWGVAMLGFAVAALTIGLPWLLIVLMVLWPGAAAWITDPPHRQRSVLRHWIPRWSALVVAPVTMIIVGGLAGWLNRPGLPFG
ncbi:hypothetical protein [Microlunatus soli]|uniref:Uncharacterized protein n=1 Tax=Microlunatus soli TaxID=630515 RepID=A0A1H1QX16_9ACTN|nr:hypothetical protein [Microlunatus soli]SDS27916.1 hypothetical protein SAMN04489812_1421 [Microlunatus soli]